MLSQLKHAGGWLLRHKRSVLLGLAQCAHIMAMAVQRLRPRVQVTIGPWIERGFYYDFDTPEDERLTEADLKVIKKEMQRIIKADLPFTCEEVRILPLCSPGSFSDKWLRAQAVAYVRSGASLTLVQTSTYPPWQTHAPGAVLPDVPYQTFSAQANC